MSCWTRASASRASSVNFSMGIKGDSSLRLDNPIVGFCRAARLKLPGCRTPISTTDAWWRRFPLRWRMLRADLALLGVAAVWGATFVLVRDALTFAGPFTFLAVRFGLATVLLAPLLLRAGRRAALDGRLARAGAVLGTLLCAGYGFQTAGLQFTTPARAAFITGLSVVVVPLLAAVGLGRPVARGIWLGVALATVGLALLSLGPELASGRGRVVDPHTLVGDVLVLGCAFVF